MPAHIKFLDNGKQHGWYLVDGYLKRSLKTTSKGEAEARLKDYIRGKFNLKPCPTVQEFYDGWVARLVPPLYRHSRIRDHKQAFRKHILPRFGTVPLVEIKTGVLRQFQAELLKTGLKVKSVRNVIDSSFRALYRDARGEIEALEGKDPFLDIKWPKVKRLPPDPLSADDKRAIVECFAEHEPIYYPFVRFQFDTGCRPSETIALTWADINTERRSVRINKSRHLNADNDHPKTTHSERIITVTTDLMELICELRHPWTKPTDKVFLNKFGDPITVDQFRKDYWERILEALKIRKRKFYSTRHTFITLCVESGKYTLKQIADYCGTSVQMIESNYCAQQILDPEASEMLERSGAKMLNNLASPTGFEPVLSA